jgi:hypothetical protein
MSDQHGFSIALAFDTDDPQFARGFEAGRIWEALKTGDLDQLDGQPIHATNGEMVLRMAEAHDVALTAEFTDDDVWMVLRLAV